MTELKRCPFHKSRTCGCRDSLDIPDSVWQTRPLEDEWRTDSSKLYEALRVANNIIRKLNDVSKLPIAEAAMIEHEYLIKVERENDPN